MSALVYDVIRRYLEYRGFEVTHVLNFTDVDDKIIQRANQLGIDPLKLAEVHINEYNHHLEDLNVLPATVNPRASREMDTIINMIKGLVEKGFAYPAAGDVYFRVQKDKTYGKLSGRKPEDMKAGARIEIGEKKEDPLDFALWKAAKPGEPAWDSPWGKGRPGWHIECSAMNLTHLGAQIDIHGGGNDLIFPHHENEIAQSECYTGKPFARYWVHNGMLQFSGEKMSKSVGNLVTVEEFLSSHSGDTLRFLVLNSGYRNPLAYNDEILQQAESGLERFRSALRQALPGSKGAPPASLKLLLSQMEVTKKNFIDAMDDDFNSAGAMGFLFEFVRVINQTRADGATESELNPGQTLLQELTAVLGLRLEVNGKKAGDADPFIGLLLNLRKSLRDQKLWALSDQIREGLNDLGVVIEDNKEGTTWRWK